MQKSPILSLFLPLLAACAITSAHAATAIDVPPAPRIPAGDFPITKFGAIGDGKAMNTDAFASAVAACEQAGGGSVIVPPGIYLTGPFTLGSHMALIVQKGATIQATGKFSDSGLPDPLPATQSELNHFHGLLHPLITATDVTDLAIKGEGTIDGAGAPWWAKSDRAARTSGTTYVPRPNLIVIKGCTRLLVSGVTLQNSPYFHLVPHLCKEVLIDGIKVHAPSDSPNTDAIDPSSCRDILIRHVVLDTGDDDIAFKCGHDGPVVNATVTDCTFLHGHGVSIGSETDGGGNNILVQRCTFENTGTALRIKTSRARGGGVIHDIVYRDITMKNVDAAIYINLFYFDKDASKYPQPKPVDKQTPNIREVTFENITCVNAKAAGEITGLPESGASNITLENVSITAWTGFTIEDAKGLTFRNVSFTTSPRPLDAPPVDFNSSVPIGKPAVKPAPAATGTGTGAAPVSLTGTGSPATIPAASSDIPATAPVPSTSAPPQSTPAGSAAPSASGTATPVPIVALTPVALTPAQKDAVASGKVSVAADGSGDFTTVQAAISAAPDAQSGSAPFIIHVKPGTYKEVVVISAKKGPINLIGDDPTTTTIAYANAASIPDANGKPMGTSHSATCFVLANHFTAQNITFANSFGIGSQALAISVTGDCDAFYHCIFLGFQDTILAQNGRQYFQDCSITGTVDFIFGSATAWFQHCDIYCTGPGYITAASTPQDHPYGYVFKDCTISGDAGVKAFLGRPWRPYASVIYLNTTMSDVIQPAGWHAWNKIDPGTTTRYTEWGTKGTGASPDTRVAWATKITDAQAAALTPQAVLAGWNPPSAAAN